MNHEYSRKRQNCEIKWFFGEVQRSDGWGSPRVLLFLYKERKVREDRGFFPRKTCELLFVRGTTSFHNKKLQILPIGEGAMWNVSM